jgi:hypothetical protein
VQDLVVPNSSQHQVVVIGKHKVLSILLLAVPRVYMVESLEIGYLLPIQPRYGYSRWGGAKILKFVLFLHLVEPNMSWSNLFELFKLLDFARHFEKDLEHNLIFLLRLRILLPLVFVIHDVGVPGDTSPLSVDTLPRPLKLRLDPHYLMHRVLV